MDTTLAFNVMLLALAGTMIATCLLGCGVAAIAELYNGSAYAQRRRWHVNHARRVARRNAYRR